jgi:hypothetical protein
MRRPDLVDRDCLRNAVNAFVYSDPVELPREAPATSLSSEAHSFSRVFTAAFLETLAGAFRISAASPGEAELAQVSRDLGALLVKAVLAAPVVPEYMSQVAAALVAADAAGDGAARGRYGDVLKGAFVRRGILSLQSAAGMATFHAAGVAPAAVAMGIAGGQARREVPHVAISGTGYGFGDLPLLIRAPAEPRRLAVAGAARGVGSLTPSSSEQAARAYLEHILQRGHVDLGDAGKPGVRVAHPHSLKTHRLKATPEGLVLQRILFNCGFHAI